MATEAVLINNAARHTEHKSETFKSYINSYQTIKAALTLLQYSWKYNILIFFQPFEDYLGICFEYAFKKVTLKYKKM